MGSLNKTYSKEKLLGQIFTPKKIVKKILNDMNYTNNKILGKKILDPACGDGRFLEEIVGRIIKESDKNNLKKNLNCVYGWDIDEEHVKTCVEKLNKLINDYDINIKWNIMVFNPIYWENHKNMYFEKFDYIAGNPPYIRIQHLDLEQRKYIQKNYSFCKKGSTDIYIAFFELSLQLLNKNGICGLITPNTFFYTVTALPLRDFFIKNQYLIKITNYREKQIFKNAKIYTAITIFNKNSRTNFVYEISSNNQYKHREINFNEIIGKKIWQLSIKTINYNKGSKLGDICKIHVGITTLADKAYIFKIEQIDDKYVYALTILQGKVKIEKEILRPIVKGSTLKDSKQKINEFILFPYYKIKNKHKIIDEKDLKNKYPLAYKYLKSIKDLLNKRDNGKPNPIAWYAFGRNQALDTSFGEKIIFSPMNKKPKFIYFPDKESTVYSGYFIKYKGNYEKLLEQLNSDRMKEYIDISSRDFRGGWKAYNKRILENFIIE